LKLSIPLDEERTTVNQGETCYALMHSLHPASKHQVKDLPFQPVNFVEYLELHIHISYTSSEEFNNGGLEALLDMSTYQL
jgi:hypothetical protein